MNIYQSVFLGILQGLTEFLPVSSSGHIVLIENLLKIKTSVPFIVFLHFATLLAVVVYFFGDVIYLAVNLISGVLGIALKKVTARSLYFSNTSFKTACLLLLGTVCTGAIAFVFNDLFESLFTSVLAVGAALILTGILLCFAEWFGKGNRFAPQMGMLDAILIGIAQGCAVAPGLSRSGATISAALLLNLKKDFAARFSFLLSVPAIMAAGLFEYKELLKLGETQMGLYTLLAAFAAAFISGLIAIKIFLSLLSKGNLKVFAYYCFVVGVAAVVWSIF